MKEKEKNNKQRAKKAIVKVTKWQRSFFLSKLKLDVDVDGINIYDSISALASSSRLDVSRNNNEEVRKMEKQERNVSKTFF